MNYFDTLTAAINDLTEHGFDSVERIDMWVTRLRDAANASLRTPAQAQAALEQGLKAIYDRLIERGGIAKMTPGVKAYTLANIKPKLRPELDRRIMASAQLIKRNRTEAIEKTLRRFEGWATSIPKGGTDAKKKTQVKTEIRKSLASLPWADRRVLIDQGHKLSATLSNIVAVDTGAIAARWRSNWRQSGYNYRKDHKERDQHIYLIRNSWAQAKGFVKPGEDGYTDQITQPAEEVFCFPGESEIPFARNVEKAFRRFYTGPISSVTLSSGTVIRATPNHPVLTNKGWIAIGLLNQSHNVVEVSKKILKPFEKYENDAGITRIADIFGTLNKDAVVQPLGLRTADFNGDTSVSDVDVVDAAGSLSFGRVLRAVECHENLGLSKALNTSTRIRTLGLDFEAVHNTPTRFMRLCYKTLAFFGRSAAHSREHTFGASTNTAASLLYCTDYNRARDVFTSSNFKNAYAALVQFAKRLPVWKQAALFSKFGAEVEALAPGGSEQRADVHADDIGHLGQGLPFATQLSKVVEVQRDSFTGHVYNLQTASGWYVSQNVVSHNCRCFYVYIYNLRDMPESMVTDKGREDLARVRRIIATGPLAAPGVHA